MSEEIVESASGLMKLIPIALIGFLIGSNNFGENYYEFEIGKNLFGILVILILSIMVSRASKLILDYYYTFEHNGGMK